MEVHSPPPPPTVKRAVRGGGEKEEKDEDSRSATPPAEGGSVTKRKSAGLSIDASFAKNQQASAPRNRASESPASPVHTPASPFSPLMEGECQATARLSTPLSQVLALDVSDDSLARVQYSPSRSYVDCEEKSAEELRGRADMSGRSCPTRVQMRRFSAPNINAEYDLTEATWASVLKARRIVQEEQDEEAEAKKKGRPIPRMNLRRSSDSGCVVS